MMSFPRSLSGNGDCCETRHRGYKIFIMLNSTEHKISTAHINQSSLKMLSKEKKSYDTELIYSGVIGIQTK